MRYFTVADAEALIPRLEAIFAAALDILEKARSKEAELRRKENAEDPCPPGELAIERSQLQFLINSVNDCLQEVAKLGAIPKGVEPALVDFPFRLGGREVYLCWKLGEKKLGFYHDLESGFAGRKTLPGAI